ncbi:hypothetical protein T484DRAFT_1904481 [Baffinella frigidus]|nr:hypothetical protein T484DRAFT_1904481 [Cryptophyta sp. CCMP2293]
MGRCAVCGARALLGSDGQLQALKAPLSITACNASLDVVDHLALLSITAYNASLDVVDHLVNGTPPAVPLLISLASLPALRGSPIQVTALEILVNLSAGGGRTERALLTGGAVTALEILVNLSAGGGRTERAFVDAGAVEVLIKRAFVDAGAVEVLIKVSEEHSEEEQGLWAVKTLLNLSQHSEEEHGLWAVKTLLNLSQVPEVRGDLKAKGALQVLARVADREGRAGGVSKGGDDLLAMATAALSNLAVG